MSEKRTFDDLTRAVWDDTYKSVHRHCQDEIKALKKRLAEIYAIATNGKAYDSAEDALADIEVLASKVDAPM